MNSIRIITLTLISGLSIPGLAFGYGNSSGGSTKSCEEPVVSSEAPAPDTTIKNLSQFEFDLSGNADPKTITVEADGVHRSQTGMFGDPLQTLTLAVV